VTPSSLPRSSPAAQGVAAAGVLAFLDAVESARLDLHSLMLVRHGRVVAEGWWAPYRADLVHLLYSLSKSFTSTAIGIAEAEGLLSIDDPVVSFFPDKVPVGASPYVTGMKVRHLLAMASGHAADTWPALAGGGPDIVRSFLSLPPDEEPGSLFCYNQGCTYTLSAIITKLTGQRLVDYLRPRLLDPLGIEQARWLQSDEGVDLGFSGLHVVTESIAKLGQLYLQGGRWQGRQLVPGSYVAQARLKQIDNSQRPGDPDWQHGYGFQFWVCRHDAYRADGAFGQFCVVVPEADAVIACTSQVEDMQAEIDLFWEHLLPALSGDAPVDHAAERCLADRLAHLSTAVVEAGARPPRPGPPRPGVTFTRTGSRPVFTARLSAVRVEPADDDGTRLTVVMNGAGHSFDLRPGRWAEGELPGFRSPGVHGLLPEVAVTGGWTSADEFQADIVFVTSPHRLQLRAKTGERPTFEAHWLTTPLS
jgi:CubicO group peptidase (beta-lactamase class C family)